MANFDFVLQSGAKLHMTSAESADAFALLRVVEKIKLGMFPGADLSSAIIASEEAEAIIFRCLKRADYEGARVVKTLMDDEALGDRFRTDYLETVSKCLEVNYGPFFQHASSKSKATAGTQVVSPESK